MWGGCDACALLACRSCTSAGWWRPAGTSWPSCRTCPPCAPPSTTCASSCPACRPATTPSPPPPRWVCFQQGMCLWRDLFSCSSPQLGAGHRDLLLVTFERGRFSDLHAWSYPRVCAESLAAGPPHSLEPCSSLPICLARWHFRGCSKVPLGNLQGSSVVP